MKKLVYLAAVLLGMASCTSDEFTGDQKLKDANENTAISFNGGAGANTRATANTGTVAQMLDGQFKVYGVKSGATAGSDIQKVFVNYGVWSTTGVTTTSDSHNWEYVEESTSGVDHGTTDNPMSLSNQTIKYWDHSAADYRFVAGSPFKAFTFNVNSSTNVIESASVTGLAGHLNANPTSGSGTAISAQPIYIADPLLIPETNYSVAFGTAPVTFKFTRQQARVRVGIYETIPGYVIKEIHFYTNGASAAETANSNIILTSGTAANYFTGATDGTATITYDWTTPSYTFANGTGMTSAQNWYGGEYATGTAAAPAIPAFTSTSAGLWGGNDKDMDANGYFTVIPTPSATAAAPLLIKCDYVLLSEKDGSGETIKVTGATAAIPAAFSKWKPNTSYTYLFKISDNTNGKTNPDKPTVGLYPITFDAVTIAATDTEEGSVTTVSTPSITTYQAGSVSSAGITYAVPDKPIYITVNTNGTLASLTTTNTKLYSVAAGTTEASLMTVAPTTAATGLSILSAAETVNSVTFASGTAAKFTPTAAGTYAVEYTDGTNNKYYKVVVVGS